MNRVVRLTGGEWDVAGACNENGLGMQKHAEAVNSLPTPHVVQKSAITVSLTVRDAPGMMLLLPWDVA
jgi:hypothetical protein